MRPTTSSRFSQIEVLTEFNRYVEYFALRLLRNRQLNTNGRAAGAG